MSSEKDIQGRDRHEQKGQGVFSPVVTGGMPAFSTSLAKKSERIATAVYLVTNFLSDTEPLKGQLRSLGLALIKNASLVRYGANLEGQSFGSMQATIAETLSLLELAFIAGLISEMNFSILRREYLAIHDALEVKKTSRESRTDSVLGKNFFEAPLDGVTTERSAALVDGQAQQGGPLRGAGMLHAEGRADYKGHEITKGHTVGKMSFSLPRPGAGRPLISDKPKIALPNATTLGAAKSFRGTIEKDSRRAQIVKLVNDVREATIKDISAHFTDLSEKTIQRELLALVEEGVLKKEGERRWSRYSIK